MHVISFYALIVSPSNYVNTLVFYRLCGTALVKNVRFLDYVVGKLFSLTYERVILSFSNETEETKDNVASVKNMRIYIYIFKYQ